MPCDAWVKTKKEMTENNTLYIVLDIYEFFIIIAILSFLRLKSDAKCTQLATGTFISVEKLVLYRLVSDTLINPNVANQTPTKYNLNKIYIKH